VPRFVRALRDGAGYVQGSRFVPGGKAINTPLARWLGLRILHAPLIGMAAGYRYSDTTNGFRGYSRKFLTDPRVAAFRPVFTGYELHYYLAIAAGRLGYDVQEVPVTRAYPKHEPTPTKIKGFRGNFGILRTLFHSCLIGHAPTRAEERAAGQV
jgi:dolichol-phosphate mannosyltransferase